MAVVRHRAPAALQAVTHDCAGYVGGGTGM